MCGSDVTRARVGEGPLGDAEKGAGVTGSFLDLQGLSPEHHARTKR